MTSDAALAVVILVSAPDRPGLVADTTVHVREAGGNIEIGRAHV